MIPEKLKHWKFSDPCNYLGFFACHFCEPPSFCCDKAAVSTHRCFLRSRSLSAPWLKEAINGGLEKKIQLDLKQNISDVRNIHWFHDSWNLLISAFTPTIYVYMNIRIIKYIYIYIHSFEYIYTYIHKPSKRCPLKPKGAWWIGTL